MCAWESCIAWDSCLWDFKIEAMCLTVSRLQSICKDVISLSLSFSQIDKSPEGQFTQLMTLPRTLQQHINHIMDPPGRNRDVEETLLQVAQDPDCADVVRLGVSARTVLSDALFLPPCLRRSRERLRLGRGKTWTIWGFPNLSVHLLEASSGKNFRILGSKELQWLKCSSLGFRNVTSRCRLKDVSVPVVWEGKRLMASAASLWPVPGSVNPLTALRPCFSTFTPP